jgi:CRISPR-associated protein (TIGR02710 family)
LNTETQKSKAILISVGGTPAPIIFSLNHQRPEYICFFVSEESKDTIEKDILPHLDFRPRHHDWIVTSSAENLSECYRAISQQLPQILKKWSVDPRDLVVDYTGGTKTMSVALTLATIDNSSLYTYIGGVARTKEGLGVVINGKESMWYLDNPWDELAVSERKEARILFNRARYSAAAQIFSKTAERVSEVNKAFFEAMKELAEGYDLWDRFRHKEAKNKLYRSKKIIDTFAAASDKAEMVLLANALKNNLNFLEEIENAQEQKGLLLCYDLLANAKRRADLEDKFDDAIARVYRAIEALAQFRLEFKYGIKTSDVRTAQIPEPLREEYERRYVDEKTSKIKLPLFASYSLLQELGDELGKSFFAHYENRLRSVLDQRNRSILAHGFDPMKQETFEKMYSAVLEFAGITEMQIHAFPVLKL